MNNDLSQAIQQQVHSALNNNTPLSIIGSNSKHHLGNTCTANKTLHINEHSGILHYEPVELVLTCRAGTPLKEIEALLAEHQQMLPFEPPHYGSNATIGGTVACGLSGPRRPFAGALRDSLLGVKIINGKAEILSFGGEAMKNVAGYDVSRLMSGAMGTLGVILEVSFKVIPKPEQEITIVKKCNTEQSLALFSQLKRSPCPVSASLFDGTQLFIRLSGHLSSIEATEKIIKGSRADNNIWQKIKEHQLGFFNTDKPIWRLSLPNNTPPLSLKGKTIMEWHGCQRWFTPLESTRETDIEKAVKAVSGHASIIYNRNRSNMLPALDKGLEFIHQQLKKAFDPQGLFNPGRLYKNL